MVNKNLVGRCGLYCGACIIYRAYKDGSQKLKEGIAKDNNCKPEDVKCDGCQLVLTSGWENDNIWGRNCVIVKCLEGKKLDFCFQCDNYPDCSKFQKWYGVFKKYGEDLINNLKQIKNGQIEEWLKEEEEKWKCKNCGKPIAMVLNKCHWCGKEID